MRYEALRRCEMGRSAWPPGALHLRRERDRQTSIFCLERSAGLEQFRKGLGDPCREGH